MNDLAQLDLLPGDVILTRDRGRTSRWIRAAQILRSDDGDAVFSHAGICLGNLTIKPEVIESLWRVTRTPLEKYADSELIIYRHRWLGHEQRREIALKAVGQERAHYGPLKLVLFALDAMFGTSWFTRNLTMTTRYRVCSQFVGWCYEEVTGRENVFGKPWLALSPDDIDDHCLGNCKEWRVVYSNLRDTW